MFDVAFSVHSSQYIYILLRWPKREGFWDVNHFVVMQELYIIIVMQSKHDSLNAVFMDCDGRDVM